MHEAMPALEAILFIYGEPLSVKKIAQILKIDEPSAKEAIAQLEKSLAEKSRGLSLVLSGDKVQIATKPELENYLESLIKEDLHEALTPAALETLAIIAYSGPISRSMIDYIRGVNSSFILRVLLLRGLVDRNIDPERSNTYLYSTSFDMLKQIGVSKSADLPQYERFRGLVEKLKNSPQN